MKRILLLGLMLMSLLACSESSTNSDSTLTGEATSECNYDYDASYIVLDTAFEYLVQTDVSWGADSIGTQSTGNEISIVYDGGAWIEDLHNTKTTGYLSDFQRLEVSSDSILNINTTVPTLLDTITKYVSAMSTIINIDDSYRFVFLTKDKDYPTIGHFENYVITKEAR